MRQFSAFCILLAVSAAPAHADKVLNIFRHTDESRMMGHTNPAQDVEVHYWFGPHGTRYDDANMTMITRLDTKKFYIVNPKEKTYSTIDLPFDFKSLVGPEMAPMMEQMMGMMAASVTVTPSDRTGEYAGFPCKWYRTEVSMRMMQMSIDSCNTERVPIDYARYSELIQAQSEMSMNSKWIKDMAEKAKGFPVRSESVTTVMGKSFKGWQELKSVEDKDAPAGFYDPPAKFREIKFDPMKQQQAGH